jgi:hypothetical protein
MLVRDPDQSYAEPPVCVLRVRYVVFFVPISFVSRGGVSTSLHAAVREWVKNSIAIDA